MSEPAPSVAPAQTTVVIQPAQAYKPCCNPCHCMTLRSGARTIAILEIISCILLIIAAILILVFAPEINKIEKDWAIKHNATVLEIHTPTVIAGIAHLLVSFVLAVFLLLGVNQLSREKCCVWLVGTSIFLFVGVILGITGAVLQGGGVRGMSSTIVGILAGAFWAWYFMYVVWAFMQELKYNYRPSPTIPDPEQGVARSPNEPDAAAKPGAGP